MARRTPGMDESQSQPSIPSHPHRWFPEFWELSRKRLRPQARLMGLSLVIGVIAGVGAITFYAACQIVFYYALYDLAGYQPHHPQGEPELPFLPKLAREFQWWMILL